jgi:hypothetical protein
MRVQAKIEMDYSWDGCYRRRNLLFDNHRELVNEDSDLDAAHIGASGQTGSCLGADNFHGIAPRAVDNGVSDRGRRTLLNSSVIWYPTSEIRKSGTLKICEKPESVNIFSCSFNLEFQGTNTRESI